jgi:hypothetical protein
VGFEHDVDRHAARSRRGRSRFRRDRPEVDSRGGISTLS